MSLGRNGPDAIEVKKRVGSIAPICHPADGAAESAWQQDIRELDLTNDAELRRMLIRLDAPSRHRLAYPTSNSLQQPSRMMGIYVEHTLAGVLAFYEGAKPGHADLALVVDVPWRRRGLGQALLIHSVGDQRATNLRLIFSRRNWAMRRLARKVNARLDLLMDEICADIAVGPIKPEQLPIML